MKTVTVASCFRAGHRRGGSALVVPRRLEVSRDLCQRVVDQRDGERYCSEVGSGAATMDLTNEIYKRMQMAVASQRA